MKIKAVIWGIIAACFIAAMSLLMQYRAGYILPVWIEWQERDVLSSDFSLSVSDRGAGIQNLWQSDKNIKVQDALICDIDHDGESELMLLCWRRGRYGASRPFWETEEEKTWSQHIYIYDLTDNEVTPIWMASYIGVDVVSWSFDNENRLTLTDRNNNITRWDWLTWGLERIA